jgi:hypothetical protein
VIMNQIYLDFLKDIHVSRPLNTIKCFLEFHLYVCVYVCIVWIDVPCGKPSSKNKCPSERP